MTPVILLDELKKFVETNTKDIILPVKVSHGGNEYKERSAEVYKMRLPDAEAETKRIPYIVLQFLTGKDSQDSGINSESECKIRIVAATYSEDGSEGATDVLNILTRIRTALLKQIIVGDMFALKKPLEYIVYADDTAPYYMGEMLTTWKMPEIEREVNFIWHQ